jgi:DNA-binding CsgD family transcriptional regulator
MLQTAHLLLLFTNAIGFIVIYIAIQLYREYRFKYLLSNVYMLVGFGVLTLSNTIETFLKLTVSDYYHSTIHNIFTTTLFLVLPLVIIFATYHIVSLMMGMLQKKEPVTLKKMSILIGIIFVISQIIYFIRPIFFKNLQQLSLSIAHLILYITFCFSIFYIFYSAKDIKNKGRKDALRLFAVLLFAINITLITITLSAVFDWISINAQMIILSIIVFTFNLFMVMFIKQFFHKYHTEYMISSTSKFDELAEKYNITKREREIIEFICRGKTNKEIGEELFITPLTVRDHISKIFAKTKVRSRLQLANLFRGN